jgi:hypothetical protein
LETARRAGFSHEIGIGFDSSVSMMSDATGNGADFMRVILQSKLRGQKDGWANNV